MTGCDFSFLSVFQHDEGSNCGNLGSNGGKGRYLMFPHASDGVRENNDKFSPCSIDHISKILHLKKDECFVGRDPGFRGLNGNLCELNVCVGGGGSVGSK